MEKIIDQFAKLYFGNSCKVSNSNNLEYSLKKLVEKRDLLLNQYESGKIRLNYNEYKNKEDYMIHSTNKDFENDYDSNDESDDVQPVILFSSEPIDYKLPGDFVLFYNRTHSLYNVGFNYFRFVKDIYLCLDIAADPIEACIDIDSLSYTCDEWCVIAEDKEGKILINCNPTSKHYGKLLFYSSRNDYGYISPFYFADFILIMIYEYDTLTKLIKTDKVISSIINYFAYDDSIKKFYETFDCNVYFTKRNKNIFPVLNMFLLSDLCHIILDYIYYEYVPIKKQYVIKTVYLLLTTTKHDHNICSHEHHDKDKFRSLEEARNEFERAKKCPENLRSATKSEDAQYIYENRVSIELRYRGKFIEKNVIRHYE
jgi:hypothetical protein